MLAFLMCAWIALFAGLEYGMLKKLRYPLNVYGIFCCNGLMLMGAFWIYPLLRGYLGS
jgi:hypothetical protein